MLLSVDKNSNIKNIRTFLFLLIKVLIKFTLTSPHESFMERKIGKTYLYFSRGSEFSICFLEKFPRSKVLSLILCCALFHCRASTPLFALSLVGHSSDFLSSPA